MIEIYFLQEQQSIRKTRGLRGGKGTEGEGMGGEDSGGRLQPECKIDTWMKRKKRKEKKGARNLQMQSSLEQVLLVRYRTQNDTEENFSVCCPFPDSFSFSSFMPQGTMFQRPMQTLFVSLSFLSSSLFFKRGYNY